MRNLRSHRSVAIFVFLVLTHFLQTVLAAENPDRVRFKAGEMGLLPFLEMVSERLEISIDASGLGNGSSETIAVPDAGEMTRERAKALALTSLYLSGYTWIQDTSTDLHRVVRQRDARDQEIPVISASAPLPDSDLLVTYILPVRHSPPEFIARNMRSFMPAASRIIPDDLNGAVLITDSAHNITKLKKLVERLDTPEAAKQAVKWLADRQKQAEDASCPSSESDRPSMDTPLLIALFSLIALVIGFLARGYVIRRIEGGL
ncbi:MAG: hypothetical protein NDJ89_13125 [Oligoflexia bacterium]|nr:hypothetical protein [Oligoflexia bacterium]